jgi:hypothetical protein
MYLGPVFPSSIYIQGKLAEGGISVPLARYLSGMHVLIFEAFNILRGLGI